MIYSCPNLDQPERKKFSDSLAKTAIESELKNESKKLKSQDQQPGPMGEIMNCLFKSKFFQILFLTLGVMALTGTAVLGQEIFILGNDSDLGIRILS
ncbi:MAG: hypothetical protein JEZ12_26020 [Desulfobacterium sp.]|nr:hypothetical protein [Desulfobacterium sp.]